MIRLSLRTKLLLATLVVLMPVLLLLVGNFRTAYDNLRERVLSDQERLAQVSGVIVDHVFDDGLALASSYATDPVILSFDPERINSYLARLVPLYPQYDDPVAVFDASGNLVGSAAGISPINVADREWFQTVMRTQQPTVSDVLISRGTGRPIVVMAVPIMGQNGLLGATTSVVSLDHFPEAFRSVERAPGQHIFLTDRTGRLAFYTAKPDITWEERDLSGYLPVQTALGGNTFSGEVKDSLLGDTRMVSAVPTPKYGWVVGVSIPVDLALAPVNESVLRSGIVFAGVVIFSLALALLLARLLLRPLKELTENAVALGHGDYKRRVKIETGDELERLGESFNAMADEVQRALRLREEFLSVASHELRTPLTVIKGYLQWLLRRETDEDKQRVLQTSVKQADRIAELLDEMLTVSEIQAGRVEIHRERFDLTATVKEVVDQLQTITERHRLLFHGEEPAYVEADRNQIEIVLTNLIDNAVRYSPGGGDIDVTVSKTATEAIVSVRDRGLGIPKDQQIHVFEPFFQMQPSIAGYGGIGLGLFISKQIVERNGGRIWFESEPGVGSTFYFSLPLGSSAGRQDVL